MTILTYLSIFGYLSYNINTALTQGSYTTTYAERVRNSYLDKNYIPLSADNFDYAVQIPYLGPNPETTIVDQYFSMNFMTYSSRLKENYTEGEYPRIDTVELLESERCAQTRMANMSKEDNSRWRCAKKTDYLLEQNLNYQTIMFTVGFCNNATL